MQMQCFRAGFLANQGDSSGTILCQDAQAQFLAPGTEVDVEEGRETPRWGHTQLPVNQTWLAGKSDHFHRNFRTQKLRHQWQHPFPLFTCSQSHSRGEERSLEWWRCGSSLQLDMNVKHLHPWSLTCPAIVHIMIIMVSLEHHTFLICLVGFLSSQVTRPGPAGTPRHRLCQACFSLLHGSELEVFICLHSLHSVLSISHEKSWEFYEVRQSDIWIFDQTVFSSLQCPAEDAKSKPAMICSPRGVRWNSLSGERKFWGVLTAHMAMAQVNLPKWTILRWYSKTYFCRFAWNIIFLPQKIINPTSAVACFELPPTPWPTVWAKRKMREGSLLFGNIMAFVW